MAFSPTFLTILLLLTIAGFMFLESDVRKIKKENSQLRKDIKKIREEINEISRDEK